MSSGRGGKRENAGRKAGVPNRKAREIAAQREEAGLPMPLDVLLANMDFYHAEAAKTLDKLLTELPEAGELAAETGEEAELARAAAIEALKNIMGLRKLAGEAAKDAAPYFHAKLAMVSHEHDLTDPLKKLFQEISGRAFRPTDGAA